MPRISRSEIAAIINKYIQQGYEKVSVQETSSHMVQTFEHKQKNKKVVIKYTSNGWLTIT